MTDFTIETEISKIEPERRQFFGWASITKMDGIPVIDHQGDFLEIDELEKAAYDYVLNSRAGGEMHQRVGKRAPRQVATLIESFVVTPEKVAKLGLPEGSLPLGWWTGYKVHDDAAWDGVKKGKYTALSIHGVGKRVPYEATSKHEIGKTMDMREQLLQHAFAHASDEVTFVKNVAEIADALAEREHPEAEYFGEVVKHLIGRHSQDDHDPTKKGGKGHSRAGHAKAAGEGAQLGAKIGGALGAAPGLAMAAATRNPVFLGSALRGGVQTAGGGAIMGYQIGRGGPGEGIFNTQSRLGGVGNLVFDPIGTVGRRVRTKKSLTKREAETLVKHLGVRAQE